MIIIITNLIWMLARGLSHFIQQMVCGSTCWGSGGRRWIPMPWRDPHSETHATRQSSVHARALNSCCTRTELMMACRAAMASPCHEESGRGRGPIAMAMARGA